MKKNKRFEIRISEDEKELLEQIKLSTNKNISELFREFLNSYELEESINKSKKRLKELKTEKEIIIQELYSTYSELRSNYLPYRLVFDLLKANKNYFEMDKESIRYKDYLEFEKLVRNKERFEKLDETRTKRDSLKARLNSIENQIEKYNL